MKTTKLDRFLILSPFDYQKEILLPETNKILNNPIDLRELFWWMGCWFYMGCWSGILNRRNCWSTVELTIPGVDPFRLNKYISRTSFK